MFMNPCFKYAEGIARWNESGVLILELGGFSKHDYDAGNIFLSIQNRGGAIGDGVLFPITSYQYGVVR